MKWMGDVPTSCNSCKLGIGDRFYDMKSRAGPWGCFCHRCAFGGAGVGRLGEGYGQRYEKQSDGQFVKTGG